MFTSLAVVGGSFVSAGVDSRGEVLVPSLASPPIPNLVWDPLDRRWANMCPVWACWHADQAGSDAFSVLDESLVGYDTLLAILAGLMEFLPSVEIAELVPRHSLSEDSGEDSFEREGVGGEQSPDEGHDWTRAACIWRRFRTCPASSTARIRPPNRVVSRPVHTNTVGSWVPFAGVAPLGFDELDKSALVLLRALQLLSSSNAKTLVDSISAFSSKLALSSLNLLRSPVFNIFFGLSVSRVSGVFKYSIGGCSRARRGYGCKGTCVWECRHIFRDAFPPLVCAPVSVLLCPCRLQRRPSMRSCLEEVTILAPFSTPCLLVFAGRAWLGFGLCGIKPSPVAALLHVEGMAFEEVRYYMQQWATRTSRRPATAPLLPFEASMSFLLDRTRDSFNVAYAT